MDDIKNLKINLRNEFKIIRNNVINKEEKDNEIFNNLIQNDIYKKSKVIACYLSFFNEVDTKIIIDYSIKNNKKIVIPKIIKNELEFYLFDGNYLNLKENKYKIKEPINNIKIEDFLIDLIIIPAICCNYNKYRLGYGKGYFDRYLKNKNMYKICLCYKEQLTDINFDDKNDVKMDLIITNKGYIK